MNRKSYNCFSGSICYCLESINSKYKEELFIAMSNGIDFKLDVNNYKFISLSKEHCLTEFLNDIGLCVSEIIFDNYIEFERYALDSIKSKEPIIFKYDAYFIPFSKEYLHNHKIRIGLIIDYIDNKYFITDKVLEIYNKKVDKNIIKKSVNNLAKPSIIKIELQSDFYKYIDSYNHFKNISIIKLRLNDIYNNKLDSFISDISQIICYEDLSLDQIKEFSESLNQYSFILNSYGLYFKFIGEILLNDTSISKKYYHKLEYKFTELSTIWKIISAIIVKSILSKRFNEEIIDEFSKWKKTFKSLLDILA